MHLISTPSTPESHATATVQAFLCGDHLIAFTGAESPLPVISEAGDDEHGSRSWEQLLIVYSAASAPFRMARKLELGETARVKDAVEL